MTSLGRAVRCSRFSVTNSLMCTHGAGRELRRAPQSYRWRRVPPPRAMSQLGIARTPVGRGSVPSVSYSMGRPARRRCRPVAQSFLNPVRLGLSACRRILPRHPVTDWRGRCTGRAHPRRRRQTPPFGPNATGHCFLGVHRIETESRCCVRCIP